MSGFSFLVNAIAAFITLRHLLLASLLGVIRYPRDSGDLVNDSGGVEGNHST